MTVQIMRLRAAGFIIKTDKVISFDPYLHTHDFDLPSVIKHWASVEECYVGHGHFDHVASLPTLSSMGEAKIFAAGLTKILLNWRGVPSRRLISTFHESQRPPDLQICPSRHAQFDQALVLSTLKRLQLSDTCRLCNQILTYPKGVVQSYVHHWQGRKILFVSSAGCTAQEIKSYRKMEIDYFLAPLQGHSQIEEKVAQMVAEINPKVVIPHHYDDFYPPLSESRSVPLFRHHLKEFNFKGKLLEVPQFEMVTVDERLFP